MSDDQHELGRLRAAEAVRELLWRYAWTIDSERNIDAIADMFTADAVLVNHDRFEGRGAIVDYYVGVLQALEASRHHISNSSITSETPERAHHRGSFFAVVQREGKTTLLSGDYDDIAVRCDDGRWRFAQKGNHIKLSRALPDAATT